MWSIALIFLGLVKLFDFTLGTISSKNEKSGKFLIAYYYSSSLEF